MSKWSVSYPTAGVVTVEVDAPDRESAIEAGWDKTADGDAEHSWEPMEYIVRGNVFYGPQSEVWADALDDATDLHAESGGS